MKKKTQDKPGRRAPAPRRPTVPERSPRPRGIQTMGPALYEQIRQVVRALDARDRSGEQ